MKQLTKWALIVAMTAGAAIAVPAIADDGAEAPAVECGGEDQDPCPDAAE